ncbi:MAG: NAD-dependent epimerase/dehydratase family protein [Flavobacteriaceae bacterium]|jgi:nucleoside-diphosphate-sugar epimerase|nr:NAD-dependent epimerase/dehydratase family protein [Flavobacteriaceae bacterium]
MILITGGTGLAGSYFLLEFSRKNKNFKALARKNASKQKVLDLFKLYEPERAEEFFQRIEWVEGDLQDIPSLESALEGVSEVYHLAEKVSFDEKKADELYKINVEGTKNLVSLCIDKKINKFCFAGNIAILDPKLDGTKITEEAEWDFKRLHSDYAASKYGAEMEVWRGSQEGLNVVIVNTGIVLGSGNWGQSCGTLYDFARKSIFFPSGTTGYIDVSDMAEICIRLMDSEIANERFILVSENVSYEKVIQTLRNIFKQKNARPISDFWLKKIAFLSRIQPFVPSLSKASVAGLTGKSEYSNEKIKKMLNYEFQPIEKSLEFHAKNYLKQKKFK